MSDTLARDSAALHDAIQRGAPEQEVRLHLSTIQYLAGVIDARMHIDKTATDEPDEEIAPARAADLLGMSRPRVRRLMDDGVLPYRKVGSHHRIPLSAIHRFRAAERARMEQGMAELADLQNELGLTE
ncbi:MULTISPECIES: helix-turn-helix domain-containing protein [Isoptericola]|uniref:helix-turn-helix domain-containing protein n=1 Tax=Isoptericola TaxID=254250 RepID=UPI00383BEFED